MERARRFNGAGALRPRKLAGRAHERSIPEPLQWGRGLKTPEILWKLWKTSKLSMLQWGRGLKTPEISCARPAPRTCRRFNGAGALRPRKYGGLAHEHSAKARFNGAGALRPRKCGGLLGVDEGPRCFNGAGALRPRKFEALLARVGVLRRFNGAGALRPRKCAGARRTQGRGRVASMGPGP